MRWTPTTKANWVREGQQATFKSLPLHSRRCRQRSQAAHSVCRGCGCPGTWRTRPPPASGCWPQEAWPATGMPARSAKGSMNVLTVKSMQLVCFGNRRSVRYSTFRKAARAKPTLEMRCLMSLRIVVLSSASEVER
eukprot:UN3262